MKIGIYKTGLTCLLILGLFYQTIIAQDGAKLFEDCADCHTIGGGKLTGPDLKGVTKRRSNEWLVSFIQSSAKVINSGNADAKALYKEYENTEMPDNVLTDAQVNQILAYIDGGKTETAAVDPQKAAAKHRIDSVLKANSPNDIIEGKDLFYGNMRFENGGASCASCHNATFYKIGYGGSLAKDLTKAHSRLGGFAGTKGIIKSAPFPSMKETYKDNPITEDEAAYLQLFLKSTDAQNPVQPQVKKFWFLQYALVLSLFIALIITLIWFKRKKLSVNHAILKRQERYSIKQNYSIQNELD